MGGQLFFYLGAELHHFHEEVVGEGFVGRGGAVEEVEHEVGSCFVALEGVAGLVEGSWVELGVA